MTFVVVYDEWTHILLTYKTSIFERFSKIVIFMQFFPNLLLFNKNGGYVIYNDGVPGIVSQAIIIVKMSKTYNKERFNYM